jgi:hypothetical protein
MQRPWLAAALFALVACGHPAPGEAQDGAPRPAPTDPPATPAVSSTEVAAPKLDPAQQADSVRKAREILAKAAERQNAGELVQPGRLESFHVVVRRAEFEDEKGNVATTDPDGLVFDWKKGSLRTQFVVDGKPTTKAWVEERKFAWMTSGAQFASLNNADRKADYDQLQFHRRVIDQLLQVALLGRLVAEKSRWQVLPPAAEKVVVLRRFPTQEAPDAIPLTLWIENPSEGVYGDVVRVVMHPTAEGQAPVVYVLKGNDQFPIVRVMSGGSMQPAKLRFPFSVEVHREAPGGRLKKVLDLKIGSVDVNSVDDTVFQPPKR